MHVLFLLIFWRAAKGTALSVTMPRHVSAATVAAGFSLQSLPEHLPVVGS